MTCNCAVEAFLAHLRLQVQAGDTAAATVEYYRWQFLHLTDLRPDVELAAIGLADLVFLPRTAAFVRSFRTLLRFHKIPEPGGGLSIPMQGQRERTLEPLEHRALIKAAGVTHGCHLPWMLKTIYHSGMRPEEVRLLSWAALKLERRQVELRYFKARSRRRDGVRIRFVPLPEDGEGLMDWLRSRAASVPAPKPAEKVYVNARGEGWNGNVLRLAVRRCVIRAGFYDPDPETEGISAYTWRHTFATNFLRAGGNVIMLASILGHTTLATTKRYCHPTGDDLVRAYDEAFRAKTG